MLVAESSCGTAAKAPPTLAALAARRRARARAAADASGVTYADDTDADADAATAEDDADNDDEDAPVASQMADGSLRDDIIAFGEGDDDAEEDEEEIAVAGLDCTLSARGEFSLDDPDDAADDADALEQVTGARRFRTV